MLERDIETYLKKAVEAAGGENRRVKWLGRNGAPDDVVFLNGVHFVECKATGKIPEPHQAREHNRMRKHGIAVWILDSFESIDMFIKVVGRG